MTYRLGQPSTGIGWVWPLPTFCGREAVITSHYGEQRPTSVHRGVDLLYRGLPGEPTQRPRGAARGDAHFVVPAWIPVIAAAAGRVVFAGVTSKGGSVVIDHGWRWDGARWVRTGVKWWTYYTHMLGTYPAGIDRAVDDAPGDALDKRWALLVRRKPFGGTPKRRRYDLAPSDQFVDAGQPLGWVRGDPSQGRRALWHLHFELWRNTSHGTVDPEPWMARWGRRPFNVDWSTGRPVRCAPQADDEVSVPAPGLMPRMVTIVPGGLDQVGDVLELARKWTPTHAASAPLAALQRLHAEVLAFDGVLTGQLRAMGCEPNRVRPQQSAACRRLYEFWRGLWSNFEQRWEAFYFRRTSPDAQWALRLSSRWAAAVLAEAAILRDEFRALQQAAAGAGGPRLRAA